MKYRGLTRIELLVVLCAALVLLAIFVVWNSRNCPGFGRGLATKDGTQIRGIHQTLIVYAKDHDGQFLIPSLIRRLPMNGTTQPDLGDEDISQNTTANLYSALIMENYVSSEFVVSPLERNPKVAVRKNYNFDLYNPAKNVYWDPAFTADLVTGSNASYAHLPITGQSRVQQWRSSLDPKFAVMGNRGPKDGLPSKSSWACQPDGEWRGTIVFNDNHIQYVTDSDAAFLKALFNSSDPQITFTQSITPSGNSYVFKYQFD